MHVNNTISLVTGGGSGLGEAVARRLASTGSRVAVVDIDDGAATRVADAIGGTAITADVSDVRSVEKVFERIEGDLGEPPRIVVSCAGIGTSVRILPRDGSLSIDAFSRTIQTNLLGAYVVLSVAGRAMSDLPPLNEDGGRGVIVNTASVAFEDGQIGQAAYAASKGGIVSLTLPAAREFARIGVRVVTVAPGLFETPMSEGLTDEIRDRLVTNIPFPPRMGRPSEFADLVVHIVENEMLNGTTIRLDGGVRMPPK